MSENNNSVVPPARKSPSTEGRLTGTVRGFCLWAVIVVFGVLGSAGAFYSAFWQTQVDSFWLFRQPNQRDVHLAIGFPYFPDKGPLAHYTEHLAWLPNIGKDSRPEDRDSNAWTNDYAVGYWLSGPPEDLTDMLRALPQLRPIREVNQ